MTDTAKNCIAACAGHSGSKSTKCLLALDAEPKVCGTNVEPSKRTIAKVADKDKFCNHDTGKLTVAEEDKLS
jgi:hypothetical protein